MSAEKHIAHAETAAAKGQQGVCRHNWKIVEKFFARTKTAAPPRSDEKKTAPPDEIWHQDDQFTGFGQAFQACTELGLC